MELTPEEMAIREEVVDRVRQMLRNSNLERFDPDVSERGRETGDGRGERCNCSAAIICIRRPLVVLYLLLKKTASGGSFFTLRSPCSGALPAVSVCPQGSKQASACSARRAYLCPIAASPHLVALTSITNAPHPLSVVILTSSSLGGGAWRRCTKSQARYALLALRLIFKSLQRQRCAMRRCHFHFFISLGHHVERERFSKKTFNRQLPL